MAALNESKKLDIGFAARLNMDSTEKLSPKLIFFLYQTVYEAKQKNATREGKILIN